MKVIFINILYFSFNDSPMYPNVFISYIGESVGGIWHIEGFINNMKPEEGDSRTLPDGTKVATEKNADLKVTVGQRWKKPLPIVAPIKTQA